MDSSQIFINFGSNFSNSFMIDEALNKNIPLFHK